MAISSQSDFSQVTILQTQGATKTVGSETPTVMRTDGSGNITQATGTTVPTDATGGYAVGAQFIKTNGSSGTIFYINEGTASSCDFNAVTTTGTVGETLYATGSITNTEMLALRATPKTLVAAPGAGFVLEFISLELFFDYTAAYTESADNMAVRFTNGSGTIVSQAIEATGFVDATADTMTNGLAKIDAISAKTACDNKALVLHNTGDGEYGGGNAANVVRFRCNYRIHAAGW